MTLVNLTTGQIRMTRETDLTVIQKEVRIKRPTRRRRTALLQELLVGDKLLAYKVLHIPLYNT